MPAGPAGAPSEAPGLGHPCPRCGSPLAPGQDWCLQCGAGAPGSLGERGWRPATWIVAVTAALVLGAAAAGYAALDSSAPRAPVVTRTVAQVAAPTTSPAVTPLPTTTPTTTVPPLTLKTPKIPLATPTPKVTATLPTTATKTITTPATTTPATTTPSGEGAGEENKPQALVLDTDAASTYNPYSLPATSFGDPSLAIDGDTSTGWTALVEPATAPKLAEGLLIDLKSAQKLTSAVIVTSTPGVTVQIYGADVSTPPASITDPAWIALSHSIVLHKRHLKVALKEKTHAFRYITLWLSAAPASAVGTPTAPGHVSINELELFPAS
jgi:hypothetical protein